MFSEREEKVIKIIGRKNLTIGEIAEQLFDEEDRPFEPRISVSNCVRRIVEKCKHHKLNWTLTKTKVNNVLFVKKEKVA